MPPAPMEEGGMWCKPLVKDTACVLCLLSAGDAFQTGSSHLLEERTNCTEQNPPLRVSERIGGEAVGRYVVESVLAACSTQSRGSGVWLPRFL